MKRDLTLPYHYELAAAWCKQLLEKEEISPEEEKMLIAFGKESLKGWARWFGNVADGKGYLLNSGKWALGLVLDTIPDGTELLPGHSRPTGPRRPLGGA